MTKKNQSFFILKFESERLKDFDYDISVGLGDGRKNNEVVRLGDSAMLRELRRITHSKFSELSLKELTEKKKKITRMRDNESNRDALKKINSQIDKMIFVPEIVAITFSDVRHYKAIIKNGGLKINGDTYIRLLCGAGHARRSTVLFCEKSVYDKLDNFLSCGINPKHKINLNKFNSYYALSSSATSPVSKCGFVVVKDLEIEKDIIVDYFIENEKGTDPTFEERTVKNKFNIFDGQGLISPAQASRWSMELELDWLPSSFIFRGAWAKGLLVTFDFHKFAKDNKVNEITDIYGMAHKIENIDLILTESQFKMAGAYTSLEQYSAECENRNFGWGVSRIAPKKDKDTTTTTYQYLQPMKIETDEQIEAICEKTVDWLKQVSGGNWMDAILFLGGGGLENPTDNWFDVMTDPIVKSLILEETLVNDIYVRQYLFRILRKKIKDSYMGVLSVEGNYQFISVDPYAEAQHALGLEVTGILHEGQYYSNYWNNKDVKKVSCFRSPMTWRSEHVVLNFEDNPILDEWYKYQETDIIFNIHDDTLMKLSGADVDGDIIMTTPEFTEFSYSSEYRTPYYERKVAPKQLVVKEDLWKSDIIGFNSKIGLITNYGTTFFSLLANAETDEVKQLLINRLKTCNVMQSCQIDKMKGIQIFNIPNWWDKWNKTTPDMSEEELHKIELYNTILCTQRPYFMKYVYPKTYGRKNRKYVNTYDNLSYMRFGMSLQELLDKPDKDNKVLEFLASFHNRSPLVDSPSIMNKVCHHMEKEVDNIRLDIPTGDFDYNVLINPAYDISKSKVDKMALLYKKYYSSKRSAFDVSDEMETEDKDRFIRDIEREALETISSNEIELTNLAIYVSYVLFPKRSKAFMWKLFGGDIIVQNLMDKKEDVGIIIPVEDEFGNKDYLGKRYSMRRIK